MIKDFNFYPSIEIVLMNEEDSTKSLKDEGIDKNRGFNEIVNSPVFRNFVISEDGKTSGIIVYIKKNEQLKNFQKKLKKRLKNTKTN